MVATHVPFLFCSSNPTTPKPISTTTNGKPRIHHHQPSSTTTNGKPKNPQLRPPPPIALNTTTTSTKKSEWIKNPNPPIVLNQNHNLHQKIQANKLHHNPSLKPPQPQQKTQTQILRSETLRQTQKTQTQIQESLDQKPQSQKWGVGIGGGFDLTTHNLWTPQSPYIYVGATEFLNLV